MTDQVRRDEVAVSAVLNSDLATDEGRATETAVAAPEAPAAVTAETPTPELAAQAPTADATASGEAAAGQAEENGATFTPQAEESGAKPRRLKDLKPNMELEGKVTSIALYGVFVDIGVGRDGLVHISEMSETRIETPSELVAIGDVVTVRVKSVDGDARRISLTMRNGERTERAPRQRAPRRPEVDKDRLSQIQVGDIVEGTITGYAPFGAFADIGVGKDGLIHVSELAEGRVEKAEDAVKIGDKFQFKVLEVDPAGARISLSLRKAMRTQRMQQLDTGMIVEGTVSGLAPFGAFVDIGVGRDGLVHISALSPNRVARVEDVVKVGDKVQVKVLGVDQQSKRISLTMRLDDEANGEIEADYTAGEGSAEPSRSARTDASRYAAAAQAARERGGERGGERRERRERRPVQTGTTEAYSSSSVEEEFVGDATLADLLSKFGGPSNRRDRRRDEAGEAGEIGETGGRKQRDVIRRTLQQAGRDE